MKTLRKRRIATDAARLIAGLLVACTVAAAPSAGMVTNLEGPLLLQKTDGRVQAIARGAHVDAGDTLFTGTDGYAELVFADDSMAVMKPDTQLAIDAFSYDASRAQDDRAQLTLAAGGLQMTSGAIAARSEARHTLVTPLGNINVTPSTRFFVAYAAAPSAVAAYGRIHLAALSTGTLSDAPMLPLVVAQATPLPSSGGLAPGLYVHVIDGLINLSNKGGTQNFAAGQFGYTASPIKPPMLVPNNPGLQFTPPPSFSSSSAPQNSTGSGSKANTVDCEVR
jgi:FecR protein.